MVQRAHAGDINWSWKYGAGLKCRYTVDILALASTAGLRRRALRDGNWRTVQDGQTSLYSLVSHRMVEYGRTGSSSVYATDMYQPFSLGNFLKIPCSDPWHSWADLFFPKTCQVWNKFLWATQQIQNIMFPITWQIFTNSVFQITAKSWNKIIVVSWQFSKQVCVF